LLSASNATLALSSAEKSETIQSLKFFPIFKPDYTVYVHAWEKVSVGSGQIYK